MSKYQEWIAKEQISEVECLVPDMSGIARGKILPADKFVRSVQEGSLKIPEGVFVLTVTGDVPEVDVVDPTSPDISMLPDLDTMRPVPWYEEPTAAVICDCFHIDGTPVEIAPRHVLKRVVEAYSERGWAPKVAPELEFFLVKINEDPDYPLEPPIGRSGRAETGRQSYSIDAVNEFDPVLDDIYDFCEAQRIDIDTLNHEFGAAQMEINFNHGDPLDLADQVFLFKRTVRQAAIRHGIYATFMAKPMDKEPGSSMHIHQSVLDARTGRNLFAAANGNDTRLFLSHIAGLQKYVPAAMPLFAPNVNSYRRLQRHSDAPINVHWGRDNRTTGLRVPPSRPEDRRIENRVTGVDANPYLAIAGSLACGYLGMVGKLKPKDPVAGSAYRLAFTLPRHLSDALARLQGSKPLKELLGERFIEALMCVKEEEFEAFMRVVSSWEREHLLLNV